MKRLWMQIQMEIRRLMRNPYYIIFSLLMPAGFYILFTNVISTGNDPDGIWKTYALMSMTSFSVMGTAVVTLCARNVEEASQGYTTLVRVTPLPGSVYFIGKMAGQSLIHLFSIIAMFVIGVLVNGISLPWTTWILCAAWILFGSCAFLALGSLLGLMKRIDLAVGVGNILYFALAIFGGMWMPPETLPKFVQSIGEWLPSYSYRNGVWLLVDGTAPAWRDVTILLGYLFIFMLISIYVRNKQEVVSM
ncbi:ABC transporter permease [Paenibacillus marinisediminis]